MTGELGVEDLFRFKKELNHSIYDRIEFLEEEVLKNPALQKNLDCMYRLKASYERLNSIIFEYCTY